MHPIGCARIVDKVNETLDFQPFSVNPCQSVLLERQWIYYNCSVPPFQNVIYFRFFICFSIIFFNFFIILNQ